MALKMGGQNSVLNQNMSPCLNIFANMKVSPAQRGLRLDSSASMSPFTPPRQSRWSSCPITLRRSGRLERLDPGDSLAGTESTTFRGHSLVQYVGSPGLDVVRYQRSTKDRGSKGPYQYPKYSKLYRSSCLFNFDPNYCCFNHNFSPVVKPI